MSISVTNGPGNPTDWVGRAVANTGDFSYLDCVTTAADGTYSIANLDPATYELRVLAAGFSSDVRSTVVLPNRTSTVNVALSQPGQRCDVQRHASHRHDIERDDSCRSRSIRRDQRIDWCHHTQRLGDEHGCVRGDATSLERVTVIKRRSANVGRRERPSGAGCVALNCIRV